MNISNTQQNNMFHVTHSVFMNLYSKRITNLKVEEWLDSINKFRKLFRGGNATGTVHLEFRLITNTNRLLPNRSSSRIVIESERRSLHSWTYTQAMNVACTSLNINIDRSTMTKRTANQNTTTQCSDVLQEHYLSIYLYMTGFTVCVCEYHIHNPHESPHYILIMYCWTVITLLPCRRTSNECLRDSTPQFKTSPKIPS